jgi:hypothetical protein
MAKVIFEVGDSVRIIHCWKAIYLHCKGRIVAISTAETNNRWYKIECEGKVLNESFLANELEPLENQTLGVYEWLNMKSERK